MPKNKKDVIAAVENMIDENRVLAFSDAVFAFAATLLVLKIDLPVIESSRVSDQIIPAILQLWPMYLANIITFLIIGYYWLNHHVIFGLLKKFDSSIVWINIIFLVFLSFIPFPVELFGDFPREPAVVVFYSGSIAAVGLFLLIIWLYAWYHNLIGDISPRRFRYYTCRFMAAPIVFLLSMPLVYIDPVLAQFSWILVVVALIIIQHVFKYKKLSEVEKLSL